MRWLQSYYQVVRDVSRPIRKGSTFNSVKVSKPTFFRNIRYGNVCVYMCLFMCTCVVYVCIYIYIYACNVYICIYACVYVYVYIYVCRELHNSELYIAYILSYIGI